MIIRPDTEDLKKKAFYRLDHGRGKLVNVEANQLIDLCLGFENYEKQSNALFAELDRLVHQMLRIGVGDVYLSDAKILLSKIREGL